MCQFCVACFAEKEELMEHEKSVHEEKRENDSQKQLYDQENPNSCHICKISFPKKKNYRAHITIMEKGKKLVKCCGCDLKYSFENSSSPLYRHIKTAHLGKTFQCQ